jgi:hypothetical protein
MARSNRVSAVLAQADADKAVSLLNDAKILLPFLTTLSKEERKKLRKMGSKSVDYVQDCLSGAQQFEGSLAKDFPLDEFIKDGNLIKQLFTVYVAAQSFTESLSDTLMALGADCMEESDEVYATLKRAAAKNTSAKAMVDQISKRFKGQGKKAKTSTP